MYEILFRGKRTDNDEGEFIYGIPVEGEPLLGMGKRTYIITKPGVQWVDGVYMTYDECIEVDPETVGRFTGLTDRNGVKIFEGDVIEYTDGCNDWLGAVKYACDDAQFVVRFIGGDVESFDNLYSGDCEVIGNIYDNPELLEVSGNEM